MGYRLGVDIGTTFTAAATRRGDRVEVVPLGDSGAQVVPTVLYLREDGQWLVGEAALRRGARDPTRLTREFKRRLGDPVKVSVGAATFRPEELMARVLRWVVQEVARREGGRPDRLVVTHPASWGAHRRGRLSKVIKLADVGPADTCSEPDAAAMHFASTERVDVGDVVAVYDLGGGTFDAATLRKTSTGFELLGVAQGIDDLGGADFNQDIFDHVVLSLGQRLAQLDEQDPAVLAGLHSLRRECVEAKIALSTDVETTIHVALPRLEAQVRLTRSEFEQMTHRPIERSVQVLLGAVSSAGLTSHDLKAVVLVGGSAQIPLVSALVGHHVGRPVEPVTQPKLAVALGAALLSGAAEAKPQPPVVVVHRTDPVEQSTTSTETAQFRQSDGGDGSVVGVAEPDGSGAPSGATQSQNALRAKRGLAGAMVAAVLLAVILGWLSAQGIPTNPPAGTQSGPTISLSRVQAQGKQQPVVVAEGGSVSIDLGEFTIKPASATLEIDPPVVEGESWVSAPRAADVPSQQGFDRMAELLVAGPVEVTVRKNDTTTFQVVANPDRGFIKTIPAWLLIVVVLFVIAYAESVLRPVRRRGRARASAVLAMATLGAILGVAVIFASWMIGDRLLPDGVVSSLRAALAVLACSFAAVCLTRLMAAMGPTR